MHWEQHFHQLVLPFGGTLPIFLVVIMAIVLAVWSLIWKGLALWSAARAGHKRWFAILLIVNTLGILEILYLCVLNKRKK